MVPHIIVFLQPILKQSKPAIGDENAVIIDIRAYASPMDPGDHPNISTKGSTRTPKPILMAAPTI